VALTSFFSVTPNLIVEHFQGCGLSFARKSRSVTRRTLRYNHPYPDFDAAVVLRHGATSRLSVVVSLRDTREAMKSNAALGPTLTPTLSRLRERGDRVAVGEGRRFLQPAGGGPAPTEGLLPAGG
jgi:hypothetical protein